MDCYAHLPKPVMPCVPPQQLLLGQKALVTGASSGIGRAIALSLGDAGADVVINYVTDEDKAEALAEEIRRKGSSALVSSLNAAAPKPASDSGTDARASRGSAPSVRRGGRGMRESRP